MLSSEYYSTTTKYNRSSKKYLLPPGIEDSLTDLRMTTCRTNSTTMERTSYKSPRIHFPKMDEINQICNFKNSLGSESSYSKHRPQRSSKSKGQKGELPLKTKFLYSGRTLRKNFSKIIRVNSKEGMLTTSVNLKLLQLTHEEVNTQYPSLRNRMNELLTILIKKSRLSPAEKSK